MNKLSFLLIPVLIFVSVSPASARIAVPGPSVESQTRINASNAKINVPSDIYSAATSLAKSDDNVTRITIDENWVHVFYKYRTKLFWFIPVNVRFKASANMAEQKLQLGRPWWSLFAPVPARLFKEALQQDFNKIKSTNNKTTNQTRVMNVIVKTMSRVAAEH